MPEFLTASLTWIEHNPGWAYLIIFAIAFAESLLLVGAFMPGAPLLLATGALIAMGSLDLLPSLAAAALGSTGGGAISFWLGYHFKDTLRDSWPLKRYPWLLARGDRFFRRYGAMSVVLGRFLGPVRPVLPTIAGMANMPPLRFLAVDAGSAVLWAPTYILPGLLLGASLGLATEIGSRLATLILLLIVSAVLLVWAIRWFNGMLAPRIADRIEALLRWSAGRRRLGKLAASIADPYHPEFRGLLILTGLLTLSAVLVLLLTHGLGGPGPIAVDHGVAYLFERMRSPWTHDLMVLLSQIGDWQVYATVLGLGTLFLFLRRHYAAAWHWLAALPPTLAFAAGTHLWLYLAGATPPHGAHLLDDVSHSAAVWGFFATMVAHRGSDRVRWIAYSVAAVLIMLVAVARLYLGLQWFSQMLIGIALAMVWVAILATAYRRHSQRIVPGRALVTPVATIFVVTLAIHWSFNLVTDRERLAPEPETRVVQDDQWWQTQWRDIADNVAVSRPGEQVDIQWAGDIETMAQTMLAHGWQEPPGLSLSAATYWLRKDPPLAELPLLPRVHDGRHPALMLTRTQAPGSQRVLYLWDSGVELGSSDHRVWLAMLSEQRRTSLLGILRFPRTLRFTGLANTELAPSLGQQYQYRLEPAEQKMDGRLWLLIRPTPEED